MPYAVSSAFQWLAGAIYVIIALAIVYLYFFKLVPLVIGSVSTWTLGAVIQVTLVLAAVAILLGGAAVFTADWIFTQVLTSLPNTRMAYEINRITGSVMQLPAQEAPPAPGSPYGSYAAPQSMPSGAMPTPYNSGATVLGSGMVAPAPGAAASGGATPGGATPSAEQPSTPSQRLKPNALQIWAGNIQEMYNPTGDISDNTNVMSKRDIPQGVQCDVFAVANGIWTKRYEEWNLACSNDGFNSEVTITVNGTAARGLTGGKYYSEDNKLPVFGTGPWPNSALEPAPASNPTPAATPTASSNSSSSGGDADGADTSISNASSATSGQGQAASAGGPRTHTVEAGENLATIAAHYGVSVQALINYNLQRYPDLKENPDVIRSGWTLEIPEP